MTPKTVMVIAGDPSGDANAADLMQTLAGIWPQTKFIGAGGAKMAAAGVELSFDLTANSAIGPTDAVKNLGSFLKRRDELVALAKQHRPELVILVDSYSFTQPVAHGIRNAASPDWRPKMVRYTSPQVWASRPGRAEKMARDIDLLLCLFPFEKEWYTRRGTKMRVEFVGHPMFDRYGPPPEKGEPAKPTVVLLPGSRTDEIRRHLPIMLEVARKIAAAQPAQFQLVAINEQMAAHMRGLLPNDSPPVEIQVGRIAEALTGATMAISKTGTITLECAYFGVPTVTMYKVSPVFYFVAKMFITVKYASMPNLLAGGPIFPEFIQSQATAEQIAEEALKLLSNPARRAEVRAKLRAIVASLGGPGSTRRAAEIISRFVD